MSVPTFLLAGAARSGTTAVIEGLRSDPRVFITTPKEPHYFALHRTGAHFTGPGDDTMINRVAVTDQARYLELYPERTSCVALGEGSVSTLYRAEEAAPEILAVNSAMRVVVILREPVERAFSAFQYMHSRGLEPVPDFLQAVAEEPARRDAGWQHIWHYTGMSRYADSLEVFLNSFPREQLGIWFYDDLSRDYDATVRSISAFIGVEQDGGPPPAVPRLNVSGQPRSGRLARILTSAASNEAIRSTVRQATSYRFREAVRRHLVTSAELSPRARAEASPVFSDDLARLRAMLPGVGPSWLVSR